MKHERLLRMALVSEAATAIGRYARAEVELEDVKRRRQPLRGWN